MTEPCAARIKRVLVERVDLDRDPEAIDPTCTLRDDLGLDSAALLDLVVGIEEEFGIEVDTDEITEERFESIASLARFVEAKL